MHKWQHSRQPQVKRKLNNTIEREIQQIKTEPITLFSRNTVYSLWNASKRVKRPIMQIPLTKNTKMGNGHEAKNKSKNISNHLEKIFQPHTRVGKTYTSRSSNQANLTRRRSDRDQREQITKKSRGFDLLPRSVETILKKSTVKPTNLITVAFKLKMFQGCRRLQKSL